jgi:hypothetical protein
VGDGTTFTAAGFNLAVTGATTVGNGASGTLTVNSSAGTKTFADVTVNTGATWNNSGNSAIGHAPRLLLSSLGGQQNNTISLTDPFTTVPAPGKA